MVLEFGAAKKLHRMVVNGKMRVIHVGKSGGKYYVSKGRKVYLTKKAAKKPAKKTVKKVAKKTKKTITVGGRKRTLYKGKKGGMYYKSKGKKVYVTKGKSPKKAKKAKKTKYGYGLGMPSLSDMMGPGSLKHDPIHFGPNVGPNRMHHKHHNLGPGGLPPF